MLLLACINFLFMSNVSVYSSPVSYIAQLEIMLVQEHDLIVMKYQLDQLFDSMGISFVYPHVISQTFFLSNPRREKDSIKTFC